MQLTTDKKARKEIPIVTGVLDYFPLAIAEVARVSFHGNQQHNPGKPLHWDRSKSTDHEDCIGRHTLERGTIDTDNMRHSAKRAWRALAALQLELEQEAVIDREVAKFPNGVAVGRDSDYDGGNIENGQYAEGFEEEEARVVHRKIDDTHDPLHCQDCRSIYERHFGLKAGEMAAHVNHTLKVELTHRATDEARLVSYGCLPEVAQHIVGGITYCGVQNAPYVYIAGPMRGLPDDNFPAFDAARDRFVAAGFNVISPADIDRAAGDRSTDDQSIFVYRDFFALYFLKKGTGGNGMIAVLPRFEKSRGTKGEFFLTLWLGMPVLSAITGDKLTMMDVCEADLLAAFEDAIKGQ